MPQLASWQTTDVCSRKIIVRHNEYRFLILDINTDSMRLRTAPLFSLIFLLASCADSGNEERPPIVLGDSSTIVTETDSAYMSDFVSDIQLQQIPEDTVSSTAASDTARDSATSATEPDNSKQSPAPNEKGLSIPFGEVTIFIPGIEVKSYRQQDLARANGVSYQLTDGTINKNELRLSGATIQKVSQRYITGVIAKNELGTLTLDALNSTTDWSTIKGADNVYPITGLDPKNLVARKSTPAQIKAAVSRAARNKRLSRKELRKWEASVRNVRSLNQKPFIVVLKSVMWKIDGKDAKGRSFSKQVRLDMPQL